MADIKLDIVREGFSQLIQKFGQIFLHQLHQQNWPFILRVTGSSQVLDNVRMFDGAEKLAFLKKSIRQFASPWVIVLEESVME